ncbi:MULTISPECIES: GntR family transcriptional regulator [unclassified Leucobacter]|uniref:GntR family transcriptional regulator n=1 Tax=unclassified Leucobacter TaxID=2621730 RepID=UPI00069BBECC|nr:GntR family transcriptional regulator [Leucobacter sp. Ag1]
MPVPKTVSAATPARVLLRDTVRERLREGIMDGTFEPGEALHDKELQEWLGVSRTPIRDAINELARMGLVDMEPNRYTRVANPSDDETVVAMQTLGVIYSGVVRLAVPRLSARTAARIADQLDRFRDALERREPLEVRKYGFPTFELFERECGNPLLVKLCRESVDGLAFKVRSQRVLELFDIDRAAEQIADLAAATRAQDTAAAENATSAVFQLPPR